MGAKEEGKKMVLRFLTVIPLPNEKGKSFAENCEVHFELAKKASVECIEVMIDNLHSKGTMNNIESIEHWKQVKKTFTDGSL